MARSPGAFLEFSPVLSPAGIFDLPAECKTASVCPVPGSSGSYTISVIDDAGNIIAGSTSPTIYDVTSMPQNDISGGWTTHRITCIAGSVLVKFQRYQVNNSGQ